MESVMSKELNDILPSEAHAPIVLDASRDHWLLDHQFQSISIAPGAALVAALIDSHRSLVDFRFSNMIPISGKLKTPVKFVKNDTSSFLYSEDNKTEYASFRIGSRENNADRKKQAVSTNVTSLIPDQIQGDTLYAKLNHQGNNYGVAFQPIKELRKSDVGWVAEWQVSEKSTRYERLTVLFDSLTHVLAATAGASSSYYLKRFGSIEFNELPDTTTQVQIKTSEVYQAGDSYVADFEIRTIDNLVVAKVEQVEILTVTDDKPTEAIAFASTFTIDPLIEVFDFWSDKIGVNLEPKLADYGQVVQSLLSDNSVLSGDAKSNVLLIRLEDLVRTDSETAAPDRVSFPDNLSTRELPDGRVVAELNKYETDYLYQEIFVDLAYKRHNLTLLDGDTVIDIGANIGFFSLFASSQAENIKIVAIEPSPVVLPILKANLAQYCSGSTVIECGASSRIGQAEFTAYQKSSVFSSFSADSAEDREAISKIVRNSLESAGYSDEELVDKAVDEFMLDRMDAEKFMCNLISVSDVIDQQGLDRIGLLKIDAEKSEEEIVSGIRDEHWQLIDQIVIEVHLQSGMQVNTILEKLQSEGFVCIEDEEELLQDSGLVTIYAMKPERLERNSKASKSGDLHDACSLLENSIEQFVKRANKGLDVVICPSSSRDPDLVSTISAASEKMEARFSTDKRISVTTADRYSEYYPVENVFDPISEIQGHIPYTQAWYASIATSAVRKHLMKLRNPSKVLVLDCDNTLWRGIVGEVGSEAIEFGENHLALMRFALRCKKAGMLLCLASKNDVGVVEEVFKKRSDDMPIQWTDIASFRINWDRKSKNLQDMALELNLGLDSFVFVDDSPIECADVRLNCPDVFVMELSEDQNWSELFDQLWVLDQSTITSADASRTEMYQDEKNRMQYKSRTVSLAEFIEGLNIEVSVEKVTDSTVDRASQMTLRTNQFNFTTRRRTVSELSALQNNGYGCDVIKVSDRFGDYGITGLLVYKIEDNALIVDTFLLSCRVLGRGVETTLLKHLVSVAEASGIDSLRIRYEKTARNEPARMFISSLLDTNSPVEDDFEINVSVARAKEADVTRQGANSTQETDDSGAQISSVPESRNAIVTDEKYVMIASNLTSVDSILEEMGSVSSKGRPDLSTLYIAPSSEHEQAMCELWCQLLGYSELGINDDFFDLGGTSLKAVKLVSMLASQFNKNISVVSVFEKPTIAGLTSVTFDEQLNTDLISSRESSRSRASERRRSRQARKVRR